MPVYDKKVVCSNSMCPLEGAINLELILIAVCCVLSQMVCRFLGEEATENLTEKQFIPTVRKFIIRLLLSGIFLRSSPYVNISLYHSSAHLQKMLMIDLFVFQVL